MVVTDCSIREETDSYPFDPTKLGVNNKWNGKNQQSDLQPLACHPKKLQAEECSRNECETNTEQPADVHQPLICHLINHNNKFYVNM